MRDAAVGGAGLIGLALGILVGWALVGRRRKPRYVAVVVARANRTTTPLYFMTFRELHVAQEWCRRMNAAQDWTLSLDTHPPGQSTTYFEVRALPFEAG